MLRSIRWTLQLWHAAILILAVVGIGFTSFFAIQQARYHQVDAELEAAGQLIVAKLRGPGPHDRPPPRDQFGMNPDDAPPQNGNVPTAVDRLGAPDFPHRFNGPGDDGPGQDGPPPDFAGANGRPREQDRLPRDLDMPPGFMQRYGGTDEDARSFVIFKNDGTIAKAFGVPYDKNNLPAGNIRPTEGQMVHRERQSMHEVYLPGPVGSTVLAAGSVQRVNDELKKLISQLAAAAGAVLVIGLAGGWVISRFAVRPIGLMSATAGEISATKLTGRIDSRRVPTELQELAMVLNGMFGRLEIAFQQQARFTADASHELRTPLAVVLSHTELALSRERTPEEYRRTIETCNNAAGRMKSLVESLLLLSHADVGELSLQPVPMDLADVARDNVHMLSTLAGSRSITLASQLQPATMVGDPFRISQVIANLLSNAIRYNQDGGSIAVTTETILGDAVLTVVDTGTGISTEDQKQVFKRFFRADKARSRVVGGSGLGLAICKSIVEAHGGNIEITSELGVGTTFTVRLPRGFDDPALFLPEKIVVED
jgi:heavy metal sensor kinase